MGKQKQKGENKGVSEGNKIDLFCMIRNLTQLLTKIDLFCMIRTMILFL